MEITSVSEVNAETTSETHSLNEGIDMASRIIFGLGWRSYSLSSG